MVFKQLFKIFISISNQYECCPGYVLWKVPVLLGAACAAHARLTFEKIQQIIINNEITTSAAIWVRTRTCLPKSGMLRLRTNAAPQHARPSSSCRNPYNYYIQNIYFDFRSLCLLPRLGASSAGAARAAHARLNSRENSANRNVSVREQTLWCEHKVMKF